MSLSRCSYFSHGATLGIISHEPNFSKNCPGRPWGLRSRNIGEMRHDHGFAFEWWVENLLNVNNNGGDNNNNNNMIIVIIIISEDYHNNLRTLTIVPASNLMLDNAIY